jgi:hypothetical protein
VLLGKTELYEALEPRLNAGEVTLLDDPKLREQLISLTLRSGRIDVRSGEHDDHANAAAGAIWLCRPPASPESTRPAPPVIVPIDPTSAALVNVHAVTHADPFAAEW